MGAASGRKRGRGRRSSSSGSSSSGSSSSSSSSSDSSSSGSDSDSDEEIKPIGQLDQLMRRQNAGVLSSNRAKVRAIEEEDDDDVHIGGVMKLKKSVGPARDGT